LAKHGFADIEANMSGGYDPTQTDLDSGLIQAQLATYRKLGLDPQLWPRGPGSWPGYVFTDAPLKLAAGHFGLGHGAGQHAPDEYYLIESTNPKVKGLSRPSWSTCTRWLEIRATNSSQCPNDWRRSCRFEASNPEDRPCNDGEGSLANRSLKHSWRGAAKPVEPFFP
jgi:hypothetical protein